MRSPGCFRALKGYTLQPAFEVTAKGPADRMSVDLSLRDARLGDITAAATVDAIAPGLGARGTARVERLNVQALTRRATAPPRAWRVTSPATAGLMSRCAKADNLFAARTRLHSIASGLPVTTLAMSWQMDASTERPCASTRAGTRTAVMRRRLAWSGLVRRFALDLRGRAASVDLRNLPSTLPVPRVTSNLQFEYTLSARGDAWQASATLDRSTLAGASISPGTTGTFALGGGTATGTAAGAPAYTAKGEVAGLDVQRVGREFEIQALTADRYRSVVNGTFDVTGSGGGRHPLTLDVTGTLVDSQLFGALFPRMDVTTNLSGGNVRVKTTGSFAGLDPAVITGNERVAGKLSGSIDAQHNDSRLRERRDRRFARYRRTRGAWPVDAGEADD